MIAGNEQQILGIVLTAAIAAIAAMWRDNLKFVKRIRLKLDECEARDAATTKRLIGITKELGILTGRQQGVIETSERVIQEVRNSMAELKSRFNESRRTTDEKS